jgi:hypothetical protein
VRIAVLDPVAGWPPSALVDPEGMVEVCRLRAENGRAPASPPDAYYTHVPYARVLSLGVVDEEPVGLRQR